MDKQTFETILFDTFHALELSYFNNNEEQSLSKSSRLLFPFIRNKSVQEERGRENILRVSEQELRFEFIHQLLKDDRWWYSIETPTVVPYSGFADGKPEQDNHGRSAAVDTVIFNEKGKRVALIEFKANNPSKQEYWKDFVKMNSEGVENNYFVELLESATDRTFQSITDKLSNGDKDNRRLNEHFFYCVVLTKCEDKNYQTPGVYFYDKSSLSIKKCKEDK